MVLPCSWRLTCNACNACGHAMLVVKPSLFNYRSLQFLINYFATKAPRHKEFLTTDKHGLTRIFKLLFLSVSFSVHPWFI